MPQVFVVPPEEDDTPAWCCFDANIPPSSPTSASYTDSPHHVLDMHQEDVDVPLFYFNLKEPRSLQDTVPSDSETTSIMDVLMSDDCTEFDIETGLDYEEIEERPDLEANVGNDSEVVEVVKVGRYTSDAEEDFRTSTPPAHASQSLKARALGVFRILKIAEKDPLSSQSNARVILPPTNTRAKQNKLRHSLTPSSQLFYPSTTPKASQSESSFDLTEVSSTALKESGYPSSPRNIVLSSPQPSSLGLLTSSSTVSPNDRSPLPTPSIPPIPNRRHFSMTINRIFSFSKLDKDLDFSISRSDKLGALSTESTFEPETLTEEVTHLNAFLPAQKCLATGGSALEERDFSFELDSLHFDSLDFDVANF
ncbi:hypothetical protein C0992_008895 [Termitomyces sp. T32_za158]|nr:hypothetical protein C0992_008895 [Termitomyces sp. T32_za158]